MILKKGTTDTEMKSKAVTTQPTCDNRRLIATCSNFQLLIQQKSCSQNYNQIFILGPFSNIYNKSLKNTGQKYSWCNLIVKYIANWATLTETSQFTKLNQQFEDSFPLNSVAHLELYFNYNCVIIMKSDTILQYFNVRSVNIISNKMSRFSK